MSDEPRPPQLGPPELDHAEAYTLGFPIHVALTIAVDDPGGSLRLLPFVGPRSADGAVGVVLERDGRPALDRPVRRTFEAESAALAGFDLRAGERRRMLVDLSDLIPADLPPGDYLLTVSYGTRQQSIASQPIAIALHAPSPDEQAALDALAPERARARTWGRWTELPPSGDDERHRLAAPVDRHDPLRYCRLLRFLHHGDGPLAIADRARLDVLDGVYAPEAAALRAELLSVIGDDAGFAAERAAVRRDHPGLRWWMDAVTSGRSRIAFFRRPR